VPTFLTVVVESSACVIGWGCFKSRQGGHLSGATAKALDRLDYRLALAKLGIHRYPSIAGLHAFAGGDVY
jgi:hypothetical protein